jgi:hypothetical protein
VAVEVKRDGEDLRQEQAYVLEALTMVGIQCFYFSPAEGFHRFDGGSLMPGDGGAPRPRRMLPQPTHVPA